MKLIRAARVLTGRSGEVVEDGELLVDGSTISHVGPRGSSGRDGEEGVEVVDLPGRTILPGLIDSHVHLGFDNQVDRVTRRNTVSDVSLMLRMAENARKLVTSGVTTARDLGGRDFLDVELRDSIKSGMTVGPNLLVATRPITPTDGHCWYMGGLADDITDVRRVARENLRAGADCLKIMASGGQMTPGAPPTWASQYTVDEIRVVVEEARSRGKTVAAHAHGAESVVRSLEAGVTTLEHVTFLTASGTEYRADLVEQIAEAGTFVCPTVNSLVWELGKIVGTEVIDKHFDSLARMRAAGVLMVTGTDCGFSLIGLDNRADNFISSLEVFAHAGFGNHEIIEMATVRAAEACGVGAVTGCLETGKRADLIAVEGDPRDDLATLRDLDLVLVSGRAVTQKGVDTVTTSSAIVG